MGKRNSQGKRAALFDSDDDTLSTTSTSASDVPLGKDTEEMATGGHSLDTFLDALYEKRGSTRENALLGFVDAFASHLQLQFAENNYITLQHQFINSIKKGSSKEASLASRALGLLSITVGSGENAHEIMEESVPLLSQALKSGSDSLKRSSVLDCLAVVTFVGGNDHEETVKSMEIMWQLIHPKSTSNVAASSKPTPAVLAAAISGWSFLLTTIGELKLNSNNWQESISFLCNLLEKEDRSVRMAVGEAIALIFEIGTIEKSSAEESNCIDGSETEGNISRGSFAYVAGLKGKFLNQVRKLSAEAGGKGSAKKDLNSQRSLFRDILTFFETGDCPETSTKLQKGGDVLMTSTWAELTQLNFLKRFLGSGFLKHMQENELLHEIFDFTPKKNQLSILDNLSGTEKFFFSRLSLDKGNFGSDPLNVAEAWLKIKSSQPDDYRVTHLITLITRAKGPLSQARVNAIGTALFRACDRNSKKRNGKRKEGSGNREAAAETEAGKKRRIEEKKERMKDEGGEKGRSTWIKDVDSQRRRSCCCE